MLLADAAQEVRGKLYILGGGWSVTGPDVPPMALAIKLDVPWSDANASHEFELTLVDTDGRAVNMTERTPGSSHGSSHGAHEVRIEGSFEVGRPAGLPPGSDIDCAFTVNVGALPLSSGRYAWQLWIDGETAEDWQRPFQVRERP